MSGLAAAVVFTWFGMVLGISFLEAPIKFRAPGITLALGLGIGRLVFRALNALEVLAALLLIIPLAAGDPSTAEWALSVVLWVVLAVQVGLLRAPLDRRAMVIVEGGDPGPSKVHYGYIGLEAVKVAALIALGIVWLS